MCMYTLLYLHGQISWAKSSSRQVNLPSPKNENVSSKRGGVNKRTNELNPSISVPKHFEKALN